MLTFHIVKKHPYAFILEVLSDNKDQTGINYSKQVIW